MRTVMRKWWKENEQFFREKNYKAVKPPDLDLSDSPPPFTPPRPSSTLPAPPRHSSLLE